MRTAFYVAIVVLQLAGCKPSGESDLERQLVTPPPGNPGECVSFQAAEAKDDASDFYHASVYPILQEDCMDCHVSGGQAADSPFVLSGNAGADYTLVRELTERELSGFPYLLAKASGIGHTGGVRFTLNSGEAQTLVDFATLLNGGTIGPPPVGGEPDCDPDGPPTGIPGGNTDFLEGISLLSAEETLHKAAMIMLGRRATDVELASVGDDENTSLRVALRKMMQGPQFTTFLMTGANDQLLTNKFAAGVPLISDGSAYNYYRFSPIDWPGIMGHPHYTVDDFYNEDLATEPLALIAYIVNNERDYREVLQSDYTVFNSRTYEFFDENRAGYVHLIEPDSGETAAAPATSDEWVPGRFAAGVGTGYFTQGSTPHTDRLQYPHAGVLTTFPWLARWENTNTNGQRKRAKMLLRQFLGYDIELTASRPMNADALNDPNNPTFNNESCKSCHYQLDALAGTFQNWGFTGRFRNNDEHFNPADEYLREDALNDGYRNETTADCGKSSGEGGYCDGDLWYADRVPAGFVFQGDSEITEMPNDGPGRDGEHDNASLRWLASQLVQDARFPTGTVKFWYEAVFNEKPLVQPVEGDPAYDPKLQAYLAQQELIEELASTFVADNGHGTYNLKDLLVEMFVSAWFRAGSIENADGRAVELANVGMGALLTPEQLERKMKSTLGVDWTYQDENGVRRPAFTYIFNAMYGGIDSDTVNVRTRQVNPLMLAVIKRMVSEMSCEAVYHDFIRDREAEVEPFEDPMFVRPAADRTLFAAYQGATPADENAVKNMLAHLHRQLWNDGATPESPEVQHSLELFEQFWNYEHDVNSENMRCVSNRYLDVIPRLENGTPAYSAASMRTLRDMLVYFISDAQFVNE